MKKTVFLILFFLLLFVGFSISGLGTANPYIVNAETGVKEVKIAFFNVPPHIYLDEKTGQMKGAAYELLANHIAPAMKVKFVWDSQPTTIPRQISLLEENTGYVSALLVYTPDRAQKFIFPEVAYASGPSALALLKSNSLDKITKVEDIAGMSVGYASNAVITPFMKNDKVKFDLISTANFNEVNFKKLMAKRIDAVYAPDKASLLFFMKQMNLDKEFKILDLPEKSALYSVVFPKGLKDVVESYVKALNEINGPQLYLKLLSKYIDTSKL